MKRYISLACVVIAAFMAVAVPVSAESAFNPDFFTNVLDYASADGDNFVSFKNSVTLNFNLGFEAFYTYVDILIFSYGASIKSVFCGSPSAQSSLSILKVSDNLYRCYGYFNAYRNTSVLTLVLNTNSSSTTWAEVLSFKAYNNAVDTFDETAFCEIRSSDFNQTIAYNVNDEINRRIFTTQEEDPADQWFTLYIWSDNWRKYDYLEFTLDVICSEITSINAFMGTDAVPFDVSWIQSGTASNGNTYIFSVSLDLSGLDRSVSDYPLICLNGKLSVSVGDVNGVNFLGCVGSVNSQTINPVVYFLRNIWNSIKNNFTSLINNLSGWFSSVIDTLEEGFSVSDTNGSGADFSSEASEQGDQFDDITDAMQGLEKPDISGSDIDPGIIVPTADVKFATSPLTVVLSDGVIKDIFMLALIFIFAGYIIYGKR